MEASAAADIARSVSGRAACEAFLPLVVFPRERRSALEACGAELHAVIRRYLPRAGAILFRGFPVSEDEHFERFVALATSEVSPPRRGARVWAWCALPGRGQQLLLADRRELYRAVPASVRRRWAERGLAYVQRDERGQPLLSRHVSPAALHPHSREALWAQPEQAAYAGAAGWLRGLAPAAGDEDDHRRAGGASRWTVAHGDGTPLAAPDVHDVNAAVDACRSELCLETRDVLLLDPALIAHAVAPGAGAGVALRREL